MLNRKKLAAVIQEKGIKKAWLADKLSLTPETISRYLSGEINPSKTMVMAIGVYLLVDPRDLWIEEKKR